VVRRQGRRGREAHVSLFHNSRIVSVESAIRSVQFKLEGEDFIALDGGRTHVLAGDLVS
jgi:predicted 3-demethylubiquinone-9 3-methyltransferase (glyoxalase superfamily)